MPDPAMVYVVDDDEAVLLSVKALLLQHDYEVRCFVSADEFLSTADTGRPGCVVTDLQMPHVSGAELQQRLIAADSPLAVVVVTGVANVPTTVTLMERGAVTLLEKPYNHDGLLRAVQRAVQLSQQRWEQLVSRKSVEQRLASLSADERAVMQGMLANEPNKSMAFKLDLGVRTIDRRRRDVLQKMGVDSVLELARLVATVSTWETFLDSH